MELLLYAQDRSRREEKALKSVARELAKDAKTLQKVAKHLPAARGAAQRLQEKANKAMAEA